MVTDPTRTKTRRGRDLCAAILIGMASGRSALAQPVVAPDDPRLPAATEVGLPSPIEASPPAPPAPSPFAAGQGDGQGLVELTPQPRPPAEVESFVDSLSENAAAFEVVVGGQVSNRAIGLTSEPWW